MSEAILVLIPIGLVMLHYVAIGLTALGNISFDDLVASVNETHNELNNIMLNLDQLHNATTYKVIS